MVETGNKFHDKVSRLINWGHWFTFFNLIIVALISLRYIKYAGLSDSGLGIAYQFTSLIGHFSFLCAVFFGLVIFPLVFVIPNQRLCRIIICAITSFAIAFLILDTQIFELYHFHLNPLIWKFLQQPEQVEQIYSVNIHYISLPIIFVIELALSFFIWEKWRLLALKRASKFIITFLLGAFICTHLIFIWADATQYRPITQEKSIYPLSYPMTARTFLKKQGWLSDNKLLKNINKQDTNEDIKLNYPLTSLTYNDQKIEKNILMITVDSLRSDMLNEKDMPFVYGLSQQGLNYTKQFSSANNRSQGLFGLFYSLPNRYWFEVTLNYIPPVLINRLMDQHYQFGLFSSVGFLHPEFLQSAFSQLKTDELQRYSAVNNNSTTTKKWEKWFAKNSQKGKWFSFLHYEDNNQPLQGKNVSISLSARTAKIMQYQKQVLRTDSAIKKVITKLRRSKQLDNTVVIITGTNGASFEKESSVESAVNNAHVPLVVLWPGLEHKEVTRLTSSLDIVPTLMSNLLGNTNSINQYSSGQSLFDNSPRPYLLSGDLDKYVIYEQDKITLFSNDGKINTINWQGDRLDGDVDITLLIDVLSKIRRFNDY